MLTLHVGMLRRPVSQLQAWREWCQTSVVARAYLSAVASPLDPETSSHLRNPDNGAEIFLIGTAHLSKASSEEVRSAIRAIKPHTVFVELDIGRARKLVFDRHKQEKIKEQGILQALFDKVASGAGFNIAQELTKQSMAGFYRTLKAMGMDPGAEFYTAVMEGLSQNARLVCGDQDQSVTVRNITNALSLMDVLKLLTGFGIKLDAETQEKLGRRDLSGSIEAMKSRRAAHLLTKALRDFNPKLAKALIDDRDEHMVRVLRRLEGRIVGVVGIGHLDGMERRWQQHGGERLD